MLASVRAGADLVGRDAELEEIDQFLSDGPARALVLEGEAGIGKTALWLAGTERAQELGYRILRARPAQVEASLSLAGLGDLLRGIPTAAVEDLPEPQARALAAVGAEQEERAGDSTGRILGVAFLNLLKMVAEASMVLLAVDDLQWFDEGSAAVMLYALRRLGSEPVRVLATCRGEPGVELPFGFRQALEEERLGLIEVRPLSEGAIRRLLRLRLGINLTRVELHALHRAVGGNPFYALELGRIGLAADDTGAVHVPRNVQALAGERLSSFAAETRDALLFVAALAEPSQDLLARAGVLDQLDPAVDAGVLELDGGVVRFAHPLLAAAAWGDAGAERRRVVHRTLARLVRDPEQRARHLSAATDAPDPRVADLLQAAARRAHGRGAPAAAGELLDRALDLTPERDLDRWARIATGAAAAHAEASQWEAVAECVEQAQARLSPGPERAAILVAAAEMRPGLDELLRQAVAEGGTQAAGVRARLGLAEQAGLAGRWAEAVEIASDATSIARIGNDRALYGVALNLLGGLKLLDSRLDGRSDVAEALALEQDVGELPTTVYQSPRMWQGAALLFGDDPVGARAIFEERLATALERGDEMSAFQFTLVLLSAQLHAGDWSAASATGRSALALVEAVGYEYGRPILFGSLATLEAGRGDLERARALGTEAVSTLTGFGDRLWSTFALGALLLVELCTGDTVAALGHVDELSGRFPDRESWWAHYQGDELETLALGGAHDRALVRVESLRRAGAELDLPRFLAWASRGEGLVHAAEGDIPAACAALEQALDHHRRYTAPFEKGRTLLAYGSVLRRDAQRRAAREVLSEALAEFERLGARHFADVTRAELQHVGGRPPVGEHELTGAEARVARLVAQGLSNKAVAAELFVTVGTVEATLTRVYAKLGLHSRSQLAHALQEPIRPTGAGPEAGN
jgi:DNA-binding CsgD family transcriptional regulator